MTNTDMSLRDAAQAVIDRWETPLWKDAPATAAFIADLRDALARDAGRASLSANAGEPVAWLVCTEEGDPDMVFLDRLEACQYCEDDDPPKPLYLAAPPTAQAEGWRPISEAPQDGTVVDLWRPSWGGERCPDMRRVDLGKGNVFYEPVLAGPCAVRDATHFMIVRPPTSAEGVEHG